jgi:hypothetical protein
MTRHQQPQTTPVPHASTTTAEATPPGLTPAELTSEQVSRWAEQIADGRGDFPQELPESERRRLLSEVRRRLRDRLIRLIARAIAAQLHCESGPTLEDPSRAGTQV